MESQDSLSNQKLLLSKHQKTVSLNMKIQRPKFSQGWSYLFILLAVLASAFPNFSYFTFFKLLLLLVSFAIIVLSKSLISLKKNKFIFCFFIYFIYLLANIKIIDDFTLRLVFNGAVIIVSSYAALFLRINRSHLIVALALVSVFAIYAYLFNINPIDGKPQVHTQIFSLVFLSTMLFYDNRRRLLPITTFIILASKVRSALFGYLALIEFVFLFKVIKSKGWLFFLAVSIPFSLFYLLINNLDYLGSILGDSVDSLKWRVLHWGYIFLDFNFNEWLFGKGLGYSWRMSLDIDAFYADGTSYIASHSTYVKIISETGLLGLAIFISLLFYIFKQSPPPIQAIIIFYLGYGFFDEGVWHFDFLWLSILALNRPKEKNDFYINNHKRSARLP